MNSNDAADVPAHPVSQDVSPSVEIGGDDQADISTPENLKAPPSCSKPCVEAGAVFVGLAGLPPGTGDYNDDEFPGSFSGSSGQVCASRLSEYEDQRWRALLKNADEREVLIDEAMLLPYDEKLVEAHLRRHEKTDMSSGQEKETVASSAKLLPSDEGDEKGKAVAHSTSEHDMDPPPDGCGDGGNDGDVEHHATPDSVQGKEYLDVNVSTSDSKCECAMNDSTDEVSTKESEFEVEQASESKGDEKSDKSDVENGDIKDGQIHNTESEKDEDEIGGCEGDDIKLEVEVDKNITEVETECTKSTSDDKVVEDDGFITGEMSKGEVEKDENEIVGCEDDFKLKVEVDMNITEIGTECIKSTSDDKVVEDDGFTTGEMHKIEKDEDEIVASEGDNVKLEHEVDKNIMEVETECIESTSDDKVVEDDGFTAGEIDKNEKDEDEINEYEGDNIKLEYEVDKNITEVETECIESTNDEKVAEDDGFTADDQANVGEDGNVIPEEKSTKLRDDEISSCKYDVCPAGYVEHDARSVLEELSPTASTHSVHPSEVHTEIAVVPTKKPGLFKRFRRAVRRIFRRMVVCGRNRRHVVD